MSDAGSRRAFWLRVAREYVGLSQAVAARRIGLSATSAANLSRFENATRDPSLAQLASLAALYEVPLAFLVEPPETAYEVLERIKSGGSP